MADKSVFDLLKENRALKSPQQPTQAMQPTEALMETEVEAVEPENEASALSPVQAETPQTQAASGDDRAAALMQSLEKNKIMGQVKKERASGQLDFTERMALSFIRDDENRREYLRAKGVDPEQFDAQDKNEGIMGMSIADLADLTDTVMATGAMISGEVAGATIGGAAGLSGGPVGAGAGGLLGATAGGAAAGAMYDTARSEFVDSILKNRGVKESDLAFEVMSGALGPGIGRVLGTAGKAVVKSPAARSVVKSLQRLSEPALDKVASAVSFIIGGDKAATKQFLKQPDEAMKLLADMKTNKSVLNQKGAEIVAEKNKLAKAVNESYGKKLKELEPDLRKVVLDNTEERVVPTDAAGAADLVDAMGRPVERKIITQNPGPLADEAMQFLNVETKEGFMETSSKELAEGFAQDQKGAVKKVIDIAKKKQITFNDLEILRKTRNAITQQVKSGKTEGKPAEALINNIYNTALESLPVREQDRVAMSAFRNLNRDYAPAYEAIGELSRALKGTSKVKPGVGVIGESATATKASTLSNLSQFREAVKQLSSQYDPKNRLLKTLDLTSAAFEGDKLFNKGSFSRTMQSAYAGAFVGGMLAPEGEWRTGSLVGAGLGVALGMRGASPVLGRSAASALGQTPRFGLGVTGARTAFSPLSGNTEEPAGGNQ